MLRPLTEDDAEALAGLLEERSLREWLRAEDVEGVRARFRGWESGWSPDRSERWLNWIVLRQPGDEALGWVQATVRDGTAVIAYVVLPAARGGGVATAAAGTLADWLGAQPGVDRVEAVIDPANHASQVVATRAGFERTGRTRDGEDVWARP
jgi:RimJ/RimL family protein N-acetyltransferase